MAPTAAAVVFAVDAVFLLENLPLVVTGILDESAHLATTLLLLLALTTVKLPVRRPFVAAALVSSVLIDIDHVPQELGFSFLTEGTYRPYSHSAIVVIVVLLVAAVNHDRLRHAALGVAFGFTAHLARDVASSAGIPLLWPLSLESLSVPYHLYAAGIVLLAVALFLQSMRVIRSPHGAQRDVRRGW